jgi:DNA repair exonuclease SbcCD ATPase subunit
MGKISFDKIKIKNFMSFGNTWQELPFSKGINLIQGFDVNTGKSNGSGKSNIMEAVCFALYGQTIKSIKKSKITNWYNNTKCEVKLYLHIDDDKYLFYRSIKPNKFIIKKNDEQLPILSNIRNFQAKVDDEILGMDFKTFKNLVYFSPNNTISILEASKDQKRKYIESLFDLTLYSSMLKTVNSNLSTKKSEISLLENDISHFITQTQLLKDRIGSYTIADVDEYIKKMKYKELELSSLIQDTVAFDSDEYNHYEKLLKELQDNTRIFQLEKQKVISELEMTEKLNKSIDIEGIKATHDGIQEKIDHIMAELDETDISSAETEIELYQQDIETTDGQIDYTNNEYDKYTKLLSKLDIRIGVLVNKIKEIQNADTLDGQDDCPLCKQPVDHKHLESYYNDKLKEYQDEKDNFEKKRSLLVSKIESLETTLDTLKTKKLEYTDKIKVLEDKKKQYNDLCSKIKDLESMKNSLDDVDELQSKKDEYIKKYKELEVQLQEIEHKIVMNDTDISIKEDVFSKLEKTKKQYDEYQQRIKDIEKEIGSLNDTIDRLKKVNESIEKQIDSDKQSLSDIESETDVKNKQIRSKNIIIDHLEYLKVSLKDENIKQYAISSILPYLNKQTNYYLQQSGFPYSVSIDGWLDVKIVGFGVDDVDYQSLSGGERKSIDLSLQFASNDISMLQAKNTFNMMILDEMIDSSLDSVSLLRLMDIIKVRQSDTDACVYIITHKEEVKDFEFDKYIHIKKVDGFSTIN